MRTQMRARVNLVPIAFVKLVGIALLLPAWRNPDGVRARRKFPVAGHPLIAIIAPGPVAGEPDVARGRLGEYDLLL